MFNFLGGLFGSGGAALGLQPLSEESNLTTGGISFGSGGADVGQSAYASQPVTQLTPSSSSSGSSGGSSSSSIGSIMGIAMMVLALL
jgi:hypothetical protein